MTRKKKILVILGSGGHTAQMLKLLELLGDQYKYEYVVNNDDVLSSRKVDGKVYTIVNPRVYADRIKLGKLLLGAVQSIKTLIRSKPDAILSAGPGVTFPLFLFGKLFHAKCIFLESWSRAHSKSRSGFYCYFLADLFFVQWPEMKGKYPKAVYAGRLS